MIVLCRLNLIFRFFRFLVALLCNFVPVSRFTIDFFPLFLYFVSFSYCSLNSFCWFVVFRCVYLIVSLESMCRYVLFHLTLGFFISVSRGCLSCSFYFFLYLVSCFFVRLL